ncbi:MAG: type II toxin-antitoxin system VapB family antitoxin [Pseudomonadales bacterium]
MSLNIKSAEADRLVEELANLTGESKTQAVTEALRERLARERRDRDREALTADLLEIGKRCMGYGRHNATKHGEFLYNEHGLPE